MSNQVVILDDDQDMGFALALLLSRKLNVHCRPVSSLKELQDSVGILENCSVMLLDVNLGPGVPNGLDAHSWLRELGFEGRVYFLTAHARQHPLVMEAERKGVEVLEKPLNPELLCAIVRRAIRPMEVTQ